MRERIEAVLFDAGGTLVRLDFEWMSELLLQLGLAVPVERIRRAEIVGRRAYDASHGEPPHPDAPPPPLGSSGNAGAYFAGMLEAAGVPRAMVPGVLERFERRHAETGLWSRPMEGARAAIDGVRQMGLRAAVVSNSDGRAEQHLIDCGVRAGLEFVVDSHRVGIEKPDPRILDLALARLGVSADRAVYVGDFRSVDAAVARAAGSHFVLVDPYRNYGSGLDAIASMSELPEHLAGRFTPRAATATPDDPSRERSAT